MGLFDFFTGTPAEYEQVSNLTPSQLKQQKQLQKAGRGRGAGGAFGESADYWRDILSNKPEAFSAFEAPQQRQFQEQIIPDLAEQFAGMGAGNLSSSGFRNAAVSAGTDLSERLANLRAGLRQNAAQSLFGVGQAGLTPHTSYQQTNPGSEGFLSNVASGLGSAIPGAISGFMMGGPAGAAVGGGAGFLSGAFGKSSPYGNQSNSGYQGSFGQLPSFGQR